MFFISPFVDFSSKINFINSLNKNKLSRLTVNVNKIEKSP